MPALSLLLVFRTNTGYSRWNEARTLWGGVVNNCRNVVRQANTFFPEGEQSEALKDTLAANTAERRAEVYGELIATCAGCHYALGESGG